MARRALLGLVLSLMALGSAACSEDVLVGLDRANAGDAAGGSGGPAGASGGAGAGLGGSESAGATGGGGLLGVGGAAGSGALSGGGSMAECTPARCGTSIYACGDCDDNEGDGLIDADDPECLGPCDDTEGSLMLGIPGNDPGSCRADCAFDRGAARGDDGCAYTHECDQLSVAPDYPPTGRSRCEYDESAKLPSSSDTCADFRATQSSECKENCLPLAPNGCDCFGCCELPGRSGRFVWVGADGGEVGGCTLETLDDPSVCPPCTQVPSCLNPCEECEYCAGGVVPDASCPGADPCDLGRTACTGTGTCPSGNYCITGCCVPEPR